MTEKRKRLVILALISVIILIGTHKLIIASHVRSIFQQQGLENIVLYLESAGLTQSRLRDVAIGDSMPLEIGSAVFEYSLSDIIRQKVDKITLDNVKIESKVVDGAFVLYGLDGISRDFLQANSDIMIPSYFFYVIE